MICLEIKLPSEISISLQKRKKKKRTYNSFLIVESSQAYAACPLMCGGEKPTLLVLPNTTGFLQSGHADLKKTYFPQKMACSSFLCPQKRGARKTTELLSRASQKHNGLLCYESCHGKFSPRSRMPNHSRKQRVLQLNQRLIQSLLQETSIKQLI